MIVKNDALIVQLIRLWIELNQSQQKQYGKLFSAAIDNEMNFLEHLSTDWYEAVQGIK